MQRRISMKKFIFVVLFTAVVTYAQMPASPKPKSDAEKIASALQAGPKFVTQNATVIDYPTSPGGEYRVLRAGRNGWTCLPGYAASAPTSLAALTTFFCSSSRTAWLALHTTCSASEFHTCTVASGCLTNRTRWEAVLNSTSGHTS